MPEHIIYMIDLLMVLSCLFVIYGLYVIISTKMNINNIRSEYLTETVIDEINKQNLQFIKELESDIKAHSIVYIDSEFNKINRRLENKIKQLIKDKT